MKATVEITDNITVGSFAEVLSLPATKIITELFKNGLMVTINEKIDFDTAQIIVEELGLDIELIRKANAISASVRDKNSTETADEKLVSRPPVVAVMGHVDHGKTSLLDAIRGSEVVKGEAGGITQHISAYLITHNDGRKITFLDTPGHEAFAALREHGAHLTDIVVIVVAADDGIKPQTVEAIRFARKAGVKILVAITKMDKPEANIDRVKQQLAEHNLLPEEWGGETVIVPLSARTGEGIDQLLDMVLLIADVDDLKSVEDTKAKGLIIESHMEQGRGAVAEALVTRGTLKAGDYLVAGGTYAKIRNLESTTGSIIESATPSTPVNISGFKSLPEFGEEFFVVENEKLARLESIRIQAERKQSGSQIGLNSSELIRIINRSNQLQELNIIVKADVQGSLTSVIDSLKTLSNEEVSVRVVASGVGSVTESDIYTAASTKSIIYGFSVALPPNIKQLAARDKVSVRKYSIIYELIDDVKRELSQLLAPEVVDTIIGKLIVKGIFKTTKTETICGGEVMLGKLSLPALVRVTRNDKILYEAEMTMLKKGPQEAKEVVEGEMCGISIKTKSRIDIIEGDILEMFRREVKERSL